MDMKAQIKKYIKDIVFEVPVMRDYVHGWRLYRKYRRSDQNSTLFSFLSKQGQHLSCCPRYGSKAEQTVRLLERVDIQPVENKRFFYSLDPFKSLSARKKLYDNCTGDMELLVKSSLQKTSEPWNSVFLKERMALIGGLRGYLERARQIPHAERYEKQFAAIESLFVRPAENFFEALQRILFYNQFLWQTGHTLNGLGHLDWILEELYEHDLSNGVLTKEAAKELLKDFFRVLHEHYWFKSAALMGDTGQIVILGGRGPDGKYHCNDLTYLFIEVSEELRMPDPKVLLRCTADMPEDLLEAAVDCIATGIGAPLLSNDDTVIPAMLSCGYEEADAYNYGVSACWEPLVPGQSFEPNNIASLNFAVPFTEMLSSLRFSETRSMEEILKLYEEHLASYIKSVLTPLTERVFEEDPLLSLASPSALEREKDITRGGAKYNNMGLTSVGLGTVVNSLLNIQKLAFEEKRYTLDRLNELRMNNFNGQDELVQELKDLKPCFGCDEAKVVRLVRELIGFTSGEFSKYRTKYDGVFKFGLSSPSYITEAQKVPATFDGRRDGDPFSVHISSASAMPTTELLSFAMKLNYNENRLNGNVIDFITSPGMLKQNREKYAALMRAGFAGGIFQLQINVVDSKTLIAAKADPTLFPSLVVRVWGFSAYFNDLPEEYKDVLIARALESEKAS